MGAGISSLITVCDTPEGMTNNHRINAIHRGIVPGILIIRRYLSGMIIKVLET